LFFSYQANAISVADFTPALDKKVANMKTTQEKVNFLQSFSDLLTTPKFTKDKNAWVYKDLREYTLNMLNVFQHELKQEQTKSQSKTTASTKTSTTKSTSTTKTTSNTSKSSTKLPHLSDNFSNIDEQKVRNAILSWHNDERYNV
jgi:polyribonucleotide nucleotidyltransferase